MHTFTKLEEKIVRHLAKHISVNDEISLTALAEECFCAKSTVVKAVKKLGYQGFADLSHSIRFNVQSADGILLPKHVLESDESSTLGLIAKEFERMEQARNFIFSGDRRTGRMLASYMSRKLALFDVFAPASYDWMFAQRHELPVGVAIFCFHKELPGKSLFGQQEGYGESMLQAAAEHGFRLLVFSDDVSKLHSESADLVVRISENDHTDEDLYIPKVLMVFEQALSLYSQAKKERADI